MSVPFANEPNRIWFRATLPLHSPSRVHHAMLVYMFDKFTTASGLIPHISQGAHCRLGATLDLGVWFHAHDFRADQWMLLEAKSDVGGECGRG